MTTVVPMLRALSSVRSAPTAFALVLSGLMIASFYTSIGGILKADLFPAEVRAVGVGLAHSIATAAFGGSAEYLALLMKLKGVEQYFFYYAAAVLGVSFVAALLLPDLRHKGFLDGSGELNGGHSSSGPDRLNVSSEYFEAESGGGTRQR